MTQFKTPRVCLVAVLALLATGCASYGPYDVPDCGTTEEAPLFSVFLTASEDEQSFEFNPPDDGDLCVTVTRLDRVTSPQTPGASMSLQVGPDPVVAALAGGRSFGLEYDKGDWKGDEVAFSLQLPPAVGQQFKFNSQDVDVLIEGIRRRFPPDPVDPFPEIPPYTPPGDGGGSSATETIAIPELTCDGRLMGFLHPMRFERPEFVSHGRPVIQRPARVACRAIWRIEYPKGSPATRVVEGGGTFTDAEGVFSATIPADTITVRKSFNIDIKLIRIEPYCVSHTTSLCGYENKGDPEAVSQDLFLEGVVAGQNQFDVNIVDVLDVTSHGPEAAGYHTLLGARLISNDLTHPERNDKPFIIHEQIDVHNEEHTEFVVWGLAGQPVRFDYLDLTDLKEKRVDPRYEPCSFNNRQICLPFRENCSPAVCDSGDHACLEYKMLQAFLEAGYDIWIVDNFKGDADISHVAAAAPMLYQKILNFGGPLGPLVQRDQHTFPIDDLNQALVAASLEEEQESERFLLSLIADGKVLTRYLANEFFNENALPIPPAATEPQSGSRRAIVAGYSMGGVLARIGLRLWETRDQFPHLIIRDQNDRDIEVATTPSVFMEEPGDKIAMYLSLDVPHLGARVPVSVQAHLHRLKYALDADDGVSESSKVEANRAVKELTATPATQILQQEIKPALRTNSLGCFHPFSNIPLTNCTVTPLESDITSRVDEFNSTLFQGRWLELISTLRPETQNGLPATIPSIGVSNGSLAPTRPVASRQVARVSWDISSGYPDPDHHLCDEFSGHPEGLNCTGLVVDGEVVVPKLPGVQPEGGQWNNVCRRLTNQDVFVPGKNLLVTSIDLRGVSINYEMRARFRNEELVPGTGFPTLVPTKSALFQDDNGNVSSAWRDAFWQPTSQYHTNFDNDMCRVILFHADEAFAADQDGDGWPDCTNSFTNSDCRAGGRRPGLLIDPDPAANGAGWCDCAPNDENVHPGAGC